MVESVVSKYSALTNPPVEAAQCVPLPVHPEDGVLQWRSAHLVTQLRPGT